MRSARLVGPETIEILDIDEPVLVPGSVIVQVTRCGIGGTDIEAYLSGDLPTQAWFGHEWVGTVVAVGAEADGHFVGEHVVGAAPTPCGVCGPCSAGLGGHCELVLSMILGTDDLASEHGAFSEKIRVDARRIRRVPEGVDEVDAALTEPAAVAAHAVLRSGQRLGDLIVIIGGGTIGLLALQLAILAGASRVTIVDPDQKRRELACDIGAFAAFPDEAGIQVWLDSHGHGLGADVVYDCSGHSESLNRALSIVRRGGTIVAVGVSSRSSELTARRLIGNEVTLTASLGYTVGDCNRVLDLMAEDRLRVGELYDADPIMLDQLGRELERMGKRLVGRGKILVGPNL